MTKSFKRMIVLFVEGACEEKGVPELLKDEFQQIRSQSVDVRVVKLQGEGAFYQKIGGLVTTFRKQYDVHAIITLVDLHPTTRFSTVQAKQQAVQLALPEKARPLLHAHVAVHDIEAWMLADHHALAHYLKTTSIAMHHEPESINTGTPPKQHIQRLFKKYGRSYRETVDSSALLGMINPDFVAKMCPHFAAFRETFRAFVK